jgi:hypothetical protein
VKLLILVSIHIKIYVYCRKSLRTTMEIKLNGQDIGLFEALKQFKLYLKKQRENIVLGIKSQRLIYFLLLTFKEALLDSTLALMNTLVSKKFSLTSNNWSLSSKQNQKTSLTSHDSDKIKEKHSKLKYSTHSINSLIIFFS